MVEKAFLNKRTYPMQRSKYSDVTVGFDEITLLDHGLSEEDIISQVRNQHQDGKIALELPSTPKLETQEQYWTKQKIL